MFACLLAIGGGRAGRKVGRGRPPDGVSCSLACSRRRRTGMRRRSWGRKIDGQTDRQAGRRTLSKKQSTPSFRITSLPCRPGAGIDTRILLPLPPFHPPFLPHSLSPPVLTHAVSSPHLPPPFLSPFSWVYSWKGEIRRERKIIIRKQSMRR